MNPDELTTQQLRDILLERELTDGRELQAKYVEPLLRAMLEKNPTPRRIQTPYSVGELSPTTYTIEVDGVHYFVGVSVHMIKSPAVEPKPDPITALLGRRKKTQ